MRALVLASDQSTARSVASKLQREGWAVDVVDSLPRAQRVRDDVDYDCLVLDREAAGGDALAWLIELREGGDVVPVLLMSTDNSPPERIRAFAVGADDYVAKPVNAVELALRVRRAVVRVPAVLPDIASLEVIGPVSISRAMREVYIDERPAKLSATQFCLVELLLSNRHRTVSIKEMREHCWDRNLPSTSDPVPPQLTRVRKAMAGAMWLHSPRYGWYQARVEGVEDYPEVQEEDLPDGPENFSGPEG